MPLDLPSEAILAWEHGAFTQTDYAGFLLRGRLDDCAMSRAVIHAKKTRPEFNANLVSPQKGPWRTLAWQYDDKPNELEVRDFSNLSEIPADLGEWLHDRMNPLVEVPLNLALEYPVKFILFKLPDHYCFLVILFHHVAADGAGIYDFTRDVFEKYHTLVKGEKPKWAGVSSLHATYGKIEPVKPAPVWDFISDGFIENRTYPMKKAAQFISSPSKSGKGRYIVRKIIEDKNIQEALRERARKEGGSLTDLMICGSNLAIKKWNEKRGEPANIMYHGVAVNQRLRQSLKITKKQANPMSAITIPTGPEDRKDQDALLKYIINQRKEKLDKGLDIRLAQITRGLLRIGRLLPVHIRYKVLRKVLDMKISHFVTNLGIVWPELKNGKPTGRTAVRTIGELELMDIHSSVGTTEKNPYVLIVRSFLGKLYMVMVYGKWAVNEDDAEEFSQLVYDNVINYL